MNYSDNISTFDFKVDFNSGLIFIGTFNNNIEIIYYDIISKKFDYKPTKSIKINTESTINNLKFYDNKLFLTLRDGEIAFCSFYNTEFSSFNRFKLSQDESLSIQCIRTLIDEYSIIIFGEEDCFYLTIKSNLETLCKFKFVVNEKYRYNLMLSIETSITSKYYQTKVMIQNYVYTSVQIVAAFNYLIFTRTVTVIMQGRLLDCLTSIKLQGSS